MERIQFCILLQFEFTYTSSTVVVVVVVLGTEKIKTPQKTNESRQIKHVNVNVYICIEDRSIYICQFCNIYLNFVIFNI